jgi:signal transduction histidine kinase
VVFTCSEIFPLPSKVTMAHPSSSGSSLHSSSLWPAALILAAGAAVASLAAAAIGGTGGPAAAAVVVAVMAVVLAMSAGVVVEVLRRRYRSAAVNAAAQHARELDKLDGDWRSHSDAQAAKLATSHAAFKHLVQARLPAALRGSSIPPASGEHRLDQTWAELFDQLISQAAEAAEQGREDQESLRLLVVSLARRVQASAHRIQAAAERMAERHPRDPDVLQVSMGVDHAAAQQGRLAQSLAVLCGERPGQQWQEPLALVDVVRAGSARIVPFERVEVSGDSDVAVAAPAVEALIHLVAELLANAAQSSPPATKVLATVRTVQRGAVIEIDDGGLGMDEQRLERARKIVAGDRPVVLSELGENPQAGLAVVGSYCRRYGFRTDVSESPYGGIRAVVLVPIDMMEIVEPTPTIPARMDQVRSPIDPLPAEVALAAAPEVAGQAWPVATADAQPLPALPRRASRRGLPTPVVETPPDAPTPLPTPTPEQAGDWMTAFVSGGPASTHDVGASEVTDGGEGGPG